MNSMSGSMGMGSGSMGMGGQPFQQKRPHGYNIGRVQNFTPEMMQLFQSLFSNLGPDSFMSRLGHGEEGIFDEMEAPAMRQFQNLQGMNASRFSGMGMGARRGSGFQNTMNQATSDFAQDLQSRRMDLQRQAIKDLMGMGGDLLQQRPFDTFLAPKKKSFMQELMIGAAPEVTRGLVNSFSGSQAIPMG